MFTRLARATRAALTTFRRSFDAAGGSGRWPAVATMPAPVSAGLAARGPLSQRAAYLYSNSSYASAYVEALVTNIVGVGPAIRSGHPDEAMRQALETAFAKAYCELDVEGGDLTEFLARVVRSWVIAGEAFAQLATDETGALRLRLLSPEQVDPTVNRDLDGGGRIVAGVEIDSAGRRLAYWILPDNPTLPFVNVRDAVRVPADDILHVFEPVFPGQVRGISKLAPIATAIIETDKLQDALLARANVSALFGAFVSDPEGTSGFTTEGTPTAPGRAELSLEPGTVRILPPGCTITFPNMPDAAGAPDLLRAMIRSISAGGSVPYELISSDLSMVNYSSARLGLHQFQRRVRALQRSLIAARLLEPVWRRFVTLEILSGRIAAADFESNADSYFVVTTVFPGWPSLDPLKEAKGAVLELGAKLRSRAETISERGRDPAEVDQEIADDPFTPDPATSDALLMQPEDREQDK
jgi:lambda family phage portal protein